MQTKHFPNIHSWSNDEVEKAFRYFTKEIADERNPIEIASLREKLYEISVEQMRRGAAVRK